MIQFDKLRYRNVLSTGKTFTEINFQDCATTLIIGKNGHGKSTLIDALFYSLYGKPYRKIKMGQLINSVNKKDLLTETEFNTNGQHYLIRRGMKPGVFEIFRNGTLIDQSDSSKDYQKILESDILKLDAKSFRKIVVLAKTDYVPYMQLPAASRREFTEDLLDLKIFSVMNTLLKERISNNKNHILDTQKEIEFSEKLIRTIENNIRSREEDSSDLVESYKEKIEENKKAGQEILEIISSSSMELVKEEKKLEGRKELQAQCDQLSKIKNNIENKISALNHKIKFYSTHDGCSECGQDIDLDFKSNFIDDSNNKIGSYESNLEECSETKKKFDVKIEAYRVVDVVIGKLEKELNNLKYQIRELANSTNSLQGFIDKLQKQTQEINLDELVETHKKLLDSQELYKKLHTEKEVLSNLGLLLKDGGLKSKIIKKYIPIINQYLSKYLEMLDLFVLFELNEDFEETVRSRFRDDFSYASFSQGEQLRIDLALVFTFRAIARMRNNADTNLLIMDETFDASLDKEGVDLLLNLIKEDQKGNNVFVISHNTDDMADSFDRTVSFVKEGNFSHMKELEL